MQYRELGASGLKVSAVGLGTWAIGGWLWGGSDRQAAVAAVQAAVEAGITLIDTAPGYGLGLAEEIVGEALAGLRDKVVLATKCGLVWHVRRGQHFFDQLGRPVHRYLGPQSVRHELEESLRRLATDRIDLYQTHWQDATTPIAETMGELEKLRREGKIRAIGVSNVSPADLEAYLEAGGVSSIQEKYSMLDRGAEKQLLPLAREKGIAALAYSPMALGLLTGKVKPGRRFPGDDLRHNNPRFTEENIRKVNALLEEVAPVAAEHRATLAQTVVAWTLAQPGVTCALCGARNPEQARENAGAGGLQLTGEELAALNAAVRRHGPGIV
jgi:aryl-alcohol dehydrogenase-like predicted oxidoreductase